MFQIAAPKHIDGILLLMREFYLAEGYPFDEATARAALEEFERGKDRAKRLYERSGFAEHSRYLLTKLLT